MPVITLRELRAELKRHMKLYNPATADDERSDWARKNKALQDEIERRTTHREQAAQHRKALKKKRRQIYDDFLKSCREDKRQRREAFKAFVSTMRDLV